MRELHCWIGSPWRGREAEGKRWIKKKENKRVEERKKEREGEHMGTRETQKY